MKRKLTRYCLAASLFIILLSLDVDSMLVRFLIAGEVPGTTIVLSPTVMLIVISILALGLLMTLTSKEQNEKLSRRIELAKKHLPKRRYSSVS